MALNLVRNSKLYFTTNVTDGVVASTGFLPANTQEIQVLEGFTFSQNTNSETVTINEAGASPIRGQRSFNTSLAPVDFSMSTYIRPYKSTNVLAEERFLWGALTSSTGASWTSGTVTSSVNFLSSNVHRLQAFGLLAVIDNVTYAIDNAVLNQATLDFGIDQIATIQWSGQASALRQLATTVTATTGTFSGGVTGTFGQKVPTAGFISNKLSTASIAKAGSSYVVPLTGGNLTINNNVTYLTPANLGVVNAPITYFTGTRAITGSLNAYLKTGGTTDTGALLSAMLADTTNVQPNYQVIVNIGGSSSSLRVDLNMPTTVVTIPTVDLQQVVSTAINFTAQGSALGTLGSTFDIEQGNELTVTYVAP